jgi:hypothetical protein
MYVMTEQLTYNTNKQRRQDEYSRTNITQDHGTRGTQRDKDPHHEWKFDHRGRLTAANKDRAIDEGVADYISELTSDELERIADEILAADKHAEQENIDAYHQRVSDIDPKYIPIVEYTGEPREDIDYRATMELMGADVSRQELGRLAARDARKRQERQYLDNDPE